MKHKLIVFILILIVAAIFAGQKLLGANSSTQQNSSSTVTAEVQKGNLTNSITASGTIETANYLSITTSVNGIVDKVYVKEGDTVKKGQKIMEITLDSEGQQSLNSAYSSYLKAKNSIETSKNSIYLQEATVAQKEKAFEDVKKSTSYQTEDERYQFQQAENAYNAAKADLENKKADLAAQQVALQTSWLSYQAQSPTITAPSDGVISNIVAVEGTQISNSVSERSIQTVASIKKVGTPIASLDITELDINKISVGQTVRMTLNSISDKTFRGKVVGIDKVGTSQSGVSNYPISVKFDEESDQVLPNMSVDADVILEEKQDVLYIPTSAITTSQKGEKSVTALVNGQAQKIDIQTGITNGTETEVTSGLNEGDVILIETLPTTGFTSGTSGTGTGRSFSVFGR